MATKRKKTIKKHSSVKYEWKTSKPVLVNRSDKRYQLHKKQLKERGFTDAETWSLFSMIACFTLPRLKLFREKTICHPIGTTYEEWLSILDDMIFTFEEICKDDQLEEDDEYWTRYQKGLDLFHKYFQDLWW